MKTIPLNLQLHRKWLVVLLIAFGTSSQLFAQPIASWLKDYVPATYAGVDVVAHGGGAWFQSKLSTPKLTASWADWKETTLSLKDVESHGLTEGEAIFVSKTKKSGWEKHPNVTFHEGAGYYINGYESAKMSGWDVAQTTIIQFTGDSNAFVAAMANARAVRKASERPRVIVTSDFPPIGVVKGGNVPNTMKSDPDDMQSMVRFLLYSNELEVEGLVASAGTFAMQAHKKNILGVLDQYEKVYDNLKSHDSRYPTPDYLRSVTFEGKGNNHGVPVKFGAGKQPYTDIIGKGKDSEASNAIIAAVDKPDPRPVWISVWGGPREVAQAIWDVKNTRSEAELKKFISKLRIFLIAHQDATHSWLMEEFPDLFIIESRKTYQGMFGGRDPNSNLAWVNEHIRKGHGPLCDIYPHEGMGCTGVCEGDTPAYLHLVSAVRGINNPDDPTQPSWGGQYKRKQGTNHFVDGPGRSSISKWRKDYQKEFQERADWCVTPAK